MPKVEEKGGTVKGAGCYCGIREFSEVVGVSYSMIWSLIRRGEFPGPVKRLGKKYLIPRYYLEKMRDDGTGANK